ncbi:flagellar biosynthesis anti-sigma factor FlgM [Derxia gummosa]|uniref:Negative regulator of flagellin synthesis n=1 Tax=Derxia gummosa DSM 723 TaxID=1121388 RepID=A0A8B6X7M3_9BURK|nr:flagellar biosynthesis anti-sigma factor FlgM [Derxia gummosa]
MKIGKTTEAFTSENVAQQKAKAKVSSDAGKTAPNGESVKLSSLSSTLKSVEADIKEPSFDAAKVEQVKAAIRDGKFEVDSSAVADKLIAGSSDMLARKSS